MSIQLHTNESWHQVCIMSNMRVFFTLKWASTLEGFVWVLQLYQYYLNSKANIMNIISMNTWYSSKAIWVLGQKLSADHWPFILVKKGMGSHPMPECIEKKTWKNMDE